MITKRLKTIADLIPKDSSVIDIGTDHAYLPIYLYQNNISKDITATDVSQNALKSSLNNLTKYNLNNKISLVLADGFKNIEKIYDVAVIAGMGTSTIKKILDTKKLPEILIIQSNNDHYELRKYMQDLGYKITKEVVIKDGKHYYVIIKYERGSDNLSESELLFGKSQNKEYFKYLIEHFNYIHSKSQDKQYLNYINILQSIIEKIPENY